MRVRITIGGKDDLASLADNEDFLSAWVLHYQSHDGNWLPTRESCDHSAAVMITSILELVHEARQAGIDFHVTVAMLELLNWTIDRTFKCARGDTQQA